MPVGPPMGIEREAEPSKEPRFARPEFILKCCDRHFGFSRKRRFELRDSLYTVPISG